MATPALDLMLQPVWLHVHSAAAASSFPAAVGAAYAASVAAVAAAAVVAPVRLLLLLLLTIALSRVLERGCDSKVAAYPLPLCGPLNEEGKEKRLHSPYCLGVCNDPSRLGFPERARKSEVATRPLLSQGPQSGDGDQTWMHYLCRLGGEQEGGGYITKKSIVVHFVHIQIVH